MDVNEELDHTIRLIQTMVNRAINNQKDYQFVLDDIIKNKEILEEEND